MAELASLGYTVFGVSDLVRWKDFAQTIGFQVAREEEELLSLRMDQYPQRIVLEKGIDDDLRVAGWELDSEEHLEQYVAKLIARGLKVALASEDLTASRRVQKLYQALDPNGFTHEFYFGPAAMSLRHGFRSPTLTSGFRTGRLGLGHLLVRSINYPESLKFYREVLGLRLSDRIREELSPERVVDVTFMHTRTGRHHSLATGAMPSNKILNHVMVEVQAMDDVGMAYDRCSYAGYAMQAELGHHPNDQTFSFYVVTPSGFSLEVGWGGLVVDDENWQAVTYDKLSDWGHKRKPPANPPSVDMEKKS